MDEYREVYFEEYCKSCKYCEQSENKSPCNECLDEPVNLYSEKPVMYSKSSTRDWLWNPFNFETGVVPR